MLAEISLTILATIYHPNLAGKNMANSRAYDPAKLTVAFNLAPIGTKILVCSKTACARAEVTDRMKYNDRIDLCQHLARKLGIKGKGMVTVRWDSEDLCKSGEVKAIGRDLFTCVGTEPESKKPPQ